MWLVQSIRAKRLTDSRSAWTRQQVLEHQSDSLRSLLQHVWTHSPFYRDYYSDHGIAESELGDLTVRDLPIVNKEILMASFDRLSNDPLLRRDKLEQWIHSGANNPYAKRFMVVHTSGSSGNTASSSTTRQPGVEPAASSWRTRRWAEGSIRSSDFALRCASRHTVISARLRASEASRRCYSIPACVRYSIRSRRPSIR